MSALATADSLRSFPVGNLSDKMSHSVLYSPQVLLTGTRSSRLHELVSSTMSSEKAHGWLDLALEHQSSKGLC